LSVMVSRFIFHEIDFVCMGIKRWVEFRDHENLGPRRARHLTSDMKAAWAICFEAVERAGHVRMVRKGSLILSRNPSLILPIVDLAPMILNRPR